MAVKTWHLIFFVMLKFFAVVTFHHHNGSELQSFILLPFTVTENTYYFLDFGKKKPNEGLK
jgi:hypothetical protein